MATGRGPDKVAAAFSGRPPAPGNRPRGTRFPLIVQAGAGRGAVALFYLMFMNGTSLRFGAATVVGVVAGAAAVGRGPVERRTETRGWRRSST